MQLRRNQKSRVKLLECLESRQLLSAAQINFANFASTTGFDFNGYSAAATTTNNTLQLTDGLLGEARSAIYGTKVPIATFTSHFSFKVAQGIQAGQDGTAEADGIAFVIDNGSTTDLGQGGSNLGYGSGTFGAQSAAIGFNLYNNGGFGSTVGFASNGNNTANPQVPGSVDFHSGDTINATATYNGTTLALTLVDATTQQTFSTSETINLPQVLGAQTAYVGFTAGTGSDDSIQTISEFDFTGSGAAPTITTVAASSPVTVPGTTSHLTVAASSNSGGTLSYAWSILHSPPGAATPTFTPNGTGSANATTATYHKAGTYIFRVTVTDSNGGSTVSDVLVVVQQTATAIKIEPHKVSIVKGSTRRYTGTVEDQFGRPLVTQPTITYAISTGGGTINATSGLYTATGLPGHLVVSAEGDNLTGVAGAVVIA
jgi:hypothetical protein